MKTRQHSRVVLGVVVTALVITSVSPVSAGLVPLGSPFAGSSWGQRFEASSPHEFDLVVVRMTSSGDSFASPALRKYSVGGWATTLEYGEPLPTWVVSEGPLASTVCFEMLFPGDVGMTDGSPYGPLEFDFVAFGKETLIESAHLSWTGTEWSYGDGDWQPTRGQAISPIPVPDAVVLGAVGLAVLGALNKRTSL